MTAAGRRMRIVSFSFGLCIRFVWGAKIRIIYVLFLSLVRKKKIPKRKDPGSTSGATPDAFQPKGQKLTPLRSVQTSLPFLTAERHPTLNTPPLMPESHAACRRYFLNEE